MKAKYFVFWAFFGDALKAFVIMALLFHFLAPTAQGFERKEVFAIISGEEACSSLEELREQLEQDPRFIVWGETRQFGNEPYLIVSIRDVEDLDVHVEDGSGNRVAVFWGERDNVIRLSQGEFVTTSDSVLQHEVIGIGLPLELGSPLYIRKIAEEFGTVVDDDYNGNLTVRLSADWDARVFHSYDFSILKRDRHMLVTPFGTQKKGTELLFSSR